MVVLQLYLDGLVHGMRDLITFPAGKENAGGNGKGFLYGRNLLSKPFNSCKFNEGRKLNKFENYWFEGPKFRGKDLN